MKQKPTLLTLLSVVLSAGFMVAPAEAADKRGNDPSGAAELNELSRVERVNALSNRFHVAPQTIAALSDSGMDWAEISAQLSLAESLHQRASDAYPTVDDALKAVRARRENGSSFTEIAEETGIAAEGKAPRTLEDGVTDAASPPSGFHEDFSRMDVSPAQPEIAPQPAEELSRMDISPARPELPRPEQLGNLPDTEGSR